MRLEDALKTSLDELRMQMLGAQVLFGFQIQGLFQNNFRAMQFSGRVLDAVGLALMIAVIGLLIAVPCQHRLVDGGETTLRIYEVSVRYATLALAPRQLDVDPLLLPPRKLREDPSVNHLLMG